MDDPKNEPAPDVSPAALSRREVLQILGVHGTTLSVDGGLVVGT